MKTKFADWLEFDPENEVLTIDGIRYARSLFKVMAEHEIGAVFRIVYRNNGTVHLERIDEKRIAPA